MAGTQYALGDGMIVMQLNERKQGRKYFQLAGGDEKQGKKERKSESHKEHFNVIVTQLWDDTACDYFPSFPYHCEL